MSSRVLWIALVGVGLLASSVEASPQQELESAKKQGKLAFVLVVEPQAAGIAQAKALVLEAMQQVRETTLVELNRSDPANAALVAKLRLAGAPLPLILLVAPNGAVAGGVPAGQATAERLVAMAPSPKKAEILRWLQDGKPVFVVVGRKGMSEQANAAAVCSAACSQMNNNSAVVQVDMDDRREATFLDQMKVDRTSKEAVTLVVNPQGQITATYAGPLEVASLVQAATKQASGCCPSTVQGGSKSCGPTK